KSIARPLFGMNRIIPSAGILSRYLWDTTLAKQQDRPQTNLYESQGRAATCSWWLCSPQGYPPARGPPNSFPSLLISRAVSLRSSLLPFSAWASTDSPCILPGRRLTLQSSNPFWLVSALKKRPWETFAKEFLHGFNGM